ncbi:MAG TPA: hypothetical protein VJQ46_13960 [Gemmatimonadales bacterium]|nr:hypothetical protein [Gemmatimonadales bacterium]
MDTGTRTETFWGSHPITNPDLGPLLTQLTELLNRGRELAAEQRANFVERAAASARKRELERTIRAVHVAHLSQAGALAARDDHSIGTSFRLAPTSGSFAAFRNAVGTMAEAAERHRDALIKHRMSPTVLADLGEALKEFDLAVERGNKARAGHVEASAQLRLVGADILRVVKLMDAIARLEFKADPALLAGWKSVSRRQAVARDTADEPAPTGDVRPAA